jgi:hypothetical protein
VARPIQAEYDRHKTESPSECKLSVQDSERLLTELIPDDPKIRITIFIDALDECEDSGYELLTCLQSILERRPHSVRLLLSSQMHVQVEPFFRRSGIESIQIHQTRTTGDMNSFITKEMDKHSKCSLKGILDSDKDLRERVAKELSARARGM